MFVPPTDALWDLLYGRFPQSMSVSTRLTFFFGLFVF